MLHSAEEKANLSSMFAHKPWNAYPSFGLTSCRYLRKEKREEVKWCSLGREGEETSQN